jgi:hypothetical protein
MAKKSMKNLRRKKGKKQARKTVNVTKQIEKTSLGALQGHNKTWANMTVNLMKLGAPAVLLSLLSLLVATGAASNQVVLSLSCD